MICLLEMSSSLHMCLSLFTPLIGMRAENSVALAWKLLLFLRNITIQPGLFWACVGSSNDQCRKLALLPLRHIYFLFQLLRHEVKRKMDLVIGNPSRCLCVPIFPSYGALLWRLTVAGTAHVESTNFCEAEGRSHLLKWNAVSYFNFCILLDVLLASND